MHDPFADLVGLKPVVKQSVPIRNVGSSSGLSSSGGASIWWHGPLLYLLTPGTDIRISDMPLDGVAVSALLLGCAACTAQDCS